MAWGQYSFGNGTLGNFECVVLLYGYDANETEPGGQGNSDKVKAYDEILQANSSGFITREFREPLAKCKTTAGLEVWFTDERPLHGEPATALNINGASTERLVTAGLPGEFTGGIGNYGLGKWRGRHPNAEPKGEGSTGTGTYRERSSTPWLGEAEATENASKATEFFLRTGVATTERAAVEAEEAAAGTPESLRTGCYPNPETEKVTLHPGFGSTGEDFTALRPDPEGCVQINIIAPEEGLEQTFQGTMEPKAVNGTRSCLTTSKAELKGTEERNGYHLESIFGPAFFTTGVAIKECGFASQQLLTLKTLP
jgi:hypothetical protein